MESINQNKLRVALFGTGFIAANFIESFRRYHPESEFLVFYQSHKLEYEFVKQLPMQETSYSELENFQPDYIICLHGNSFVPANLDIISAMRQNHLKTAEFLSFLMKLQLSSIKKILVVGSASEYGKFYNEPIKEDFPLHPTSLYGLSKICLYNTAVYYAERGLPVTYIRQFNTTGPGQRADFVTAAFCRQAALIEKQKAPAIMNVGDLTQERDFVDIRDTCQAYRVLLEHGEKGQVYNVASGNFVTIKNLLNLILGKSTVKDVKINQKEALFPNEHSLSKRLHADISRLNRLPYKPGYSLEQTVIDTLDYWRQRV